jgi:hypothetical protein
MILDGLSYDHLVDSVEIIENPTRWLSNQPYDHLTKNFRPQPWEQLIKVLREMGHTSDADSVAMAKQDALREAGKIKGVLRPLHWLYRLFAGYGYQPLWTIYWMIGIWLCFSVIYFAADSNGRFGPTSAIIQSDSNIADACGLSRPETEDSRRISNWTICAAMPPEYTTFQPFLYSLDLLLPLVDLQQDKDWSPIVMQTDGKTRMWAGEFVRAVMWFEILFGWIASVLLVAVLGNLVKKD